MNNFDYDLNKSGTKETRIVVPLKYLSHFWGEFRYAIGQLLNRIDFNLEQKLCNN